MLFCINGVDDMFEFYLWNLKEFFDECFEQWGVRLRFFWIIIMYGGKNISLYINIVFSNGELDFWLGGGVIKDIIDILVVVIILEGVYYLDLCVKNVLDFMFVLLVCVLEVRYMKNWIRDFYDYVVVIV